jgi:hypothetical protein
VEFQKYYSHLVTYARSISAYRRSSKEWQTIIEQHEISGMSVAELCKQQALDNKYFHAKRQSLFKCQQRKLASLFIKVSKTNPDSAMVSLQMGEDQWRICKMGNGQF